MNEIEYLRHGYAVERGVKDPNAYPGDDLRDRLFQIQRPDIQFYVYAGLPLEAFYTISMLWHLGFNAGESHGREAQQQEIRKALGFAESEPRKAVSAAAPRTPMKRYTPVWLRDCRMNPREDEDGEYVLYSDAQAEIARLRGDMEPTKP